MCLQPHGTGRRYILVDMQHYKDMEQELQDGEGCRVYGELLVSRMEGLVRLSTHVQDFLRLQSTRADIEKQIHTALENIQSNRGVGQLDVRLLLLPAAACCRCC
jgi:hypothetical protein